MIQRWRSNILTTTTTTKKKATTTTITTTTHKDNSVKELDSMPIHAEVLQNEILRATLENEKKVSDAATDCFRQQVCCDCQVLTTYILIQNCCGYHFRASVKPLTSYINTFCTDRISKQWSKSTTGVGKNTKSAIWIGGILFLTVGRFGLFCLYVVYGLVFVDTCVMYLSCIVTALAWWIESI